MTAATSAGGGEARTPTDFQAEADKFNARVAENASARAAVQLEADKINSDREILVRLATDYGVTPKYARAALRKA